MEQKSQKHGMHLNATNALEFSHQLAAYTRDAAKFADKMDVIYLAYMLEKLAAYVDEIQDVRYSLISE
ncbi:UNVERIFIED_CONTAM: hypothetical protein K2H54_035500 [Gekko kuhli]